MASLSRPPRAADLYQCSRPVYRVRGPPEASERRNRHLCIGSTIALCLAGAVVGLLFGLQELV